MSVKASTHRAALTSPAVVTRVRSSLGLLLLLALVFPVVSACQSIGGHPKIKRPSSGSVQGEAGLVLFDDESMRPTAERVARTLAELFERAAQKIGNHRERSCEIWLTQQEWPSHATTFARCIVFQPTPERMQFVDLIMAHEFTHWHLAGTKLQANLPHPMIEGICEEVATRLVPAWREDRETLYAGMIDGMLERGVLFEAQQQLGRSIGAWYKLERERRNELTALAFWLIQDIGFERLVSEAEQGRLTARDVLMLASEGRSNLRRLH